MRATDLSQLPLVIPGADGQPRTLPLGQVAQVRPALGPARIDHLNRERVISVQANTEGRPLSEVVSAIELANPRHPAAARYAITQGGQTEEQREVFTRILLALGVAVLLMYLVLVVQFGSFLDPLAIMVSLPLSLIGVVGALMLTGDTLNIMSLIGVILLMGIVAKNAILLIDFAKWSEEQGMPRREAIVEAGRARLRPILMTTFALIAGMIPVALGYGEGADFRAPLGRAIIGGVITSTRTDAARHPDVLRHPRRLAREPRPTVRPRAEGEDQAREGGARRSRGRDWLTTHARARAIGRSV